MKKLLLLCFILIPFLSFSQEIKNPKVVKSIWVQGDSDNGYFLVTAGINFVDRNNYRNSVTYCDTTFMAYNSDDGVGFDSPALNIDSLYFLARKYLEKKMPGAIKISKKGINLHWSVEK